MNASDIPAQHAKLEENMAYTRLRKIANSASSNPYENKSKLFEIRERIIESIRWRLNYRLSFVRPYENWYLAASLWPLLIDSENKSLQSEILKNAIDKQLDSSGAWKYPLNTAYKFLMCTHTVRLWKLTGDERYFNAATDALKHLNKMKRASNGAFLYLPTRDELLVDTLGMIGPFLGACAKTLGSKEAGSLLMEQLELYWENNMDSETGLPYHGYYADGPNKLGNLGWGRGVGWYMLALSASQHCSDIDAGFAHQAYKWRLSILQTLIKYQRNDGHWNECILIKSRADSSATGMIILALTSEHQNLLKTPNINNELLKHSIKSGRQAILKSTGKSGLIRHSTGEAPSLGSYAHAYGNYPWAQGFGTAAIIQSEQWFESN